MARHRKLGYLHIEMEKGLHERDRVGVQDSVLLEDFTSETAFINNLRKRFNENLIYTYIGQVLVSVNPYAELQIYDRKTVAQYNKRHLFENPPHVFAITEAAYRNLVEERKDQCVLISGESGSGKTEASKKVLEYIAAVSSDKGNVVTVKDKLLLSNPVLEAFGNAKTSRNDNSSRFGKYMDIQFNYLGEPVGGNILNYLLEKSRVVHQHPGERNFHVFYQLLAAGGHLLASLQLDPDPSKYNYFNNWKDRGEVESDAKQMKLVSSAMEGMGLSAVERQEIFSIVGSVLHLGNIELREEAGQARAQHSTHLAAAAQLLGCDPKALGRALTQRTIEAHGEPVTSPLTGELAQYARDALAKAIYSRLFNWLVSRLNRSLQPDQKATRSVFGILDIYGFEIFQTNSFEQFCINYCNEKLQQLFIELTLKSEQEEYLREGIEWEPVEYFNNSIICQLIEQKHKGIISLLDEECLRPGDTSDKSFLDKMADKLSSHEHFISHKKADTKMQKIMSREEFKLLHYAGDVTYNVQGFLDKNNDLLFRDLRELMSETTNSITRSEFPKSELKSKKMPETAITQFKNSLNRLMEILVTKTPSYIRCIKPNDFKKSGVFSEDIISHQVKYLGLMENLRVRRAGFAYRRRYEEFLERYKSLSEDTWPTYHGPPRDGVYLLVQSLGYQPSQYRMGESKIFIRSAKTLFETEDALQARKHELAALIQSQWRGLVVRRWYRTQRQAAIVIEKWARRYLAQIQAQRRRAAVTVIRNFVEGFMTRNGPVTDLNRKFIESAKQQYLMRLARELPRNLLSKRWPVPPLCCQQASEELRRLHRVWLSRKYRLALTPERKRQLEMKVLAESVFRGKKKSYNDTIESWFHNNRLNETQNLIKASFMTSDAPQDKLVYCSNVGKFDRHGYKKRDRILLVTDSTLYLLMEDKKHFKLKHKLPLASISAYEVTSENDNFLLIRIPPNLVKDKGDLILEVPYLIEALTFIVSTTNNKDSVRINSLENGSITHNLVNGKQGLIDFQRGDNGCSISKGKTGNLIIVG